MERAPQGDSDEDGEVYDFDPSRLVDEAWEYAQREGDEMLRRAFPDVFDAIAQAYEGYEQRENERGVPDGKDYEFELGEYDDSVDWTIYYPSGEDESTPAPDPAHEPDLPQGDGTTHPNGTGQES